MRPTTPTPGTPTPCNVQSETTTLPVVTAAKTGPGGTALDDREYFDASGNLHWEEDGNGRLDLQQL